MERRIFLNRIQKQYFEIKTGLGKRPSKVEMYLRLGKKYDRYLAGDDWGFWRK